MLAQNRICVNWFQSYFLRFLDFQRRLQFLGLVFGLFIAVRTASWKTSLKFSPVFAEHSRKGPTFLLSLAASA